VTRRFVCVRDPAFMHVVWDDCIGEPAMHRGRVLCFRDPLHAARIARRLNDIVLKTEAGC